MLSWLKRILGRGDDSCVVTGYWCETEISLDTPVKTPLGGRVKRLAVCVDIRYAIEGDNITLRRVSLAQAGADYNMSASRRGEAWKAPCFRPESILEQAVLHDLQLNDSRLRAIMVGKVNQSRGVPAPATKRQKAYARHLGIAYPAGISCRDLSALITQAEQRAAK